MTMEAKWSDFSSLDGERTLSAANQLLPRWVILILVVAIAWQLASILWMLMPGSSAGDPIVATPSQLTAAAAPGSRANVQAIANAHIFGEASTGEAVTEAPAVINDNLAETRQNLSLKGTIAAIQPT